jgi:hypothetical protein
METTVNFGIDPNNRDRCVISPPCDLAYMQKQRDLLWKIYSDSLLSSDEDLAYLRTTIGFLDHFIHGIYFVAAEYHTANRSIY